MTPTPRRLQEALAQSEAGSALLHRYSASQRAASAIEAECQRIVPDFRPTQSGGCELRGTTLRLNTTQPAQVAKLRQAVPSLLRLLRQQGLNVIEIKIGVQPRALSSSVRRQVSLPPAGGQPGPGTSDHRGSQVKPALDFSRKLAAASLVLVSTTRTNARFRRLWKPAGRQKTGRLKPGQLPVARPPNAYNAAGR